MKQTNKQTNKQTSKQSKVFRITIKCDYSYE